MPKRSHAPSRLLLVAAAAAALSAGMAAELLAQAPPATLPPSDIPQLRDQLYSVSSRQDQRDAAAARLLARPGPEARAEVVASLSHWANPAVQRAGARALAEAPVADPDVIIPLFALLSSPPDKPTAEAAARALTAFKGNADVRNRLLEYARRGEYNVRLAAIAAAGTFMDKQVVQTLIELLDPGQTAPVNAAASQALAYMTGFDAATMDSTAWQKWWTDNQAKSEEGFRADLAESRAARYDRTHAALDTMADEMTRMLADQYQRAARDQRADLLLRYLRSSAPSMRAIGARIAADAAVADVTPVAVREQLRQLIGDASPDVRRRAANALALINDPDAIVPLLTQLAQETDSSVRAAIAGALRPIQDVRAVPQLLSLLDDPSTETAQAAAQALGERELGQKLRETNPALAEQAADRLRQTLIGRTAVMNHQELRNDLVVAMGAMQSRARENTLLLTAMLNSRTESIKVVRSLLQALGDLKDEQYAQAIAQRVDDDSPAVRLAAVRALGQATQSYAYEKLLTRRTDPSVEEDEQVREAAWKTLTDLFSKAPEAQLVFSANRLKDQPVRQLAVLKELRNRARARGNQDDVARVNQQIGDASKAALRFEEAIQAYQDAFDFAMETRSPIMAEATAEGLTESMLRARQYQQATDLIQKLMRSDQKWQGILAPKIKREAERLVKDEKDLEAARQLITSALSMKNPQLATHTADTLQELLGQIERRVKEQNSNPNPWLDRPLNAMAH